MTDGENPLTIFDLFEKVGGFFTEPESGNQSHHPKTFKCGVEGDQIKARDAKDPQWADWYFLAAAYSGAVNNSELMFEYLDKIKESFPDYDPLKRFVGVRSLRKGEDITDAFLDIIQSRRDVLEEFDNFLGRYPGFDFYCMRTRFPERSLPRLALGK